MKSFLNITENKNNVIGSKVTAIFMNWWVWLFVEAILGCIKKGLRAANKTGLF